MITPDQYTVLQSLAENIFKANAYDPKMKVKFKSIDQDTDKVYLRHDIEGTKAAILLSLVKQAENGGSLLSETKTPAPKDLPEPIVDHIDEFTAAELEARGDVQQPTVDQLQHPSYVDMVKKIETKPENFSDGQPQSPKLNLAAGGINTDPPTHTEGDIFADEKGRIWAIINGKKVQRKKGTTTNS